MIIEYEGTDISSSVSVSRCVWDAREEGRVPQLQIAFNDNRGVWDDWSPKPGDRITASAEGAPATGAMYVKACAPVANGYELRADAIPVADVPTMRVWRSTTLRVVVEQLAAVLGLTAEMHGCEDMLFSYVRQDGEGALPVLARICALAGCTFDVYNGALHVCSRDWIETQGIAGTLEIKPTSDYKYSRRQAYTSCMINQTAIDGVRAGFAETYGAAGHDLAIELDERIGVIGAKELRRACAGVLACTNARLSGGSAKSDSLTPFTPGSVCNVSCAIAPSLSGPAVVTRVRNDFAKKKSKVWWRSI